MSGGATVPDEAALLVATAAGQSESSFLRELVGHREEEMGDDSGLESEVEGGMGGGDGTTQVQARDSNKARRISSGTETATARAMTTIFSRRRAIRP